MMPRGGRLWILLLLGLTARLSAAEGGGRPPLITPGAHKAIEKGVAYLIKHQNRDGSWRSSGRMGGYPVVMTSLAGLGLMANGNTPIAGAHAKAVRRAVDYVVRQAERTGVIASMSEEQRSMYGHGFAMLFLAQAYGMEPDPARRKRIRQVLQRAVRLTAKSQSKAGGWYYTPGSTSDEGSVTVTQIQGLRACRNAGIKVPKETIDRACDYIGKCANKDGGIAYSLSSRGSSRPAITAAAVATMYNAGVYEHPVAEGALTFIKSLLKKNDGDPWKAFRGHVFYSLLYLGQAMWLSGDADWNAFFPTVRDRLVREQQGNGSWSGDYVGQVYGTAIALLTLQLPYQYLPIVQR